MNKSVIYSPLAVFFLLALLGLSACSPQAAAQPTPTATPAASPTPSPEIATDVDGNEYPLVEIGGQRWLASNLRTTHYQNGDEIPLITDDAVWNATHTGARSDYNNDPAQVAAYGRLYNYYAAVDSRNVCPAGWHVSSDADWETLLSGLGGSKTAAFSLMEAGTAHWTLTDASITDPLGFAVLPAGYRQFGEGFFDVGSGAYFWSGETLGLTQGWCHEFHAGSQEVLRCQGSGYETFGFSIRSVEEE